MYTTYLKKLEQIKKDKNQLTAFIQMIVQLLKLGLEVGKQQF